ncbi:MAG: helix-turn-helix domain-containing protein [Dehalococcoidia bacterium]
MAIERPERLLTVKEVAERLRVHPITVRRHIKAGRLSAVRIGRSVRVPEAELTKLSSPGPGYEPGRQTTEPRNRIAESAVAYPMRRSTPMRASTHDLSPDRDEGDRRREVFEEMRALRAKMAPLAMTTSELVREGRRELELRGPRWRKPFDEMRALREQMKPLGISTAELVRQARTAREWMYEGDD